MATYSGILTWIIPWTEEPGGLYSPWNCKESDMTEQLSWDRANTSPTCDTVALLERVSALTGTSDKSFWRRWYLNLEKWCFFFFLLHHSACGTLILWPGVKPAPPGLEAWSINYWINRQVPWILQNEYRFLRQRGKGPAGWEGSSRHRPCQNLEIREDRLVQRISSCSRTLEWMVQDIVAGTQAGEVGRSKIAKSQLDMNLSLITTKKL